MRNKLKLQIAKLQNYVEKYLQNEDIYPRQNRQTIKTTNKNHLNLPFSSQCPQHKPRPTEQFPGVSHAPLTSAAPCQ